MSFVVIAYVVMAYAVMAYIVMAYVVTVIHASGTISAVFDTLLCSLAPWWVSATCLHFAYGLSIDIAYMVMAYIVMACIFMAYIVIAYIVMA